MSEHRRRRKNDPYADLPLPRDPDRLVTTGRGGALFRTSDHALSAEVTLEIWDHEPNQSREADLASVLHDERLQFGG